jgi:cephalosporin-C deacetylase-like acetyl esterase
VSDIILFISVGVKNDGLSQEAGSAVLSAMIQERIEATVMDLPWVTDMLVTTAQSGEEI